MAPDIHDTHWKRLSRSILVDTRFLKVYNDRVQMPTGHVIDDYSVVSMPSGVVIVATDQQDRLITQFEYKYAINKTILNLPSGSVEGDEPVLEVAARELLEETGYIADDLVLVQTVYEYPSKADHVIHIVRANGAYRARDVQHEATETIGPVHLITADMKDYGGVFDTTYNITALALTLPAYLKQ